MPGVVSFSNSRPFGPYSRDMLRTGAKFLKLFEKIDWDHSGTIDIEELFGYLKMDVAGYARKTFSTMNVQHEYMDEDGRFDPRKFQAAEAQAEGADGPVGSRPATDPRLSLPSAVQGILWDVRKRAAAGDAAVDSARAYVN